jgi:hypothetical protein
VEDGREAAVAGTAELSPLPSLLAAADIGQDDGLAAERPFGRDAACPGRRREGRRGDGGGTIGDERSVISGIGLEEW